MPIIDSAVIDRANRVLKTGTYGQKLAFLKAFPVCPPSNYQGGGHAFNVTEKSPFGDTDNRDKKFLTKRKLLRAEDRIAFIRFKARPAGTGEEGALTFTLKYASDLPSDGDRTDYIPIWFLPWESGFMWKIAVDSVTHNPSLALGAGTTPIPNPDLFFTAAINGCSVFARGNADAPRIYHGGAEKSEIAEIKSQLGNAFWTQMGGAAEGMWLNLFHGLTPDPHNPDSLVPRPGGPKTNFGKVNKHQYVAQTVAGAPVVSPLSQRPGLDPMDRDRPSTQLAVGLENDLTTHLAFMNLRIEEVSPWGCAFGLRNGNNWEFYLQTNATVKYFTLRTKKKRRIGKAKYKWWWEGQLDPQGKPTQWAKAQSVNFGTQQFFPGAHPHVRVPTASFRFF